jgi:tetratricopeptide (TPR) repeat protein
MAMSHARLLIVNALFGLTVLLSITANADQTHPQLDPLFQQLQKERDLIRIAEIQNEIWALWYALPADQLHMQPIFDDGMRALSFAMPQTAIEHFTTVIEAAPNFAEAWNRRATTYFMIGDLESSLADIQQTLVLEPRHFGALSGLSMIFENTGDLERALAADRLMLELMPNHSQIRARIEGLEKRLFGQGI